MNVLFFRINELNICCNSEIFEKKLFKTMIQFIIICRLNDSHSICYFWNRDRQCLFRCDNFCCWTFIAIACQVEFISFLLYYAYVYAMKITYSREYVKLIICLYFCSSASLIRDILHVAYWSYISSWWNEFFDLWGSKEN